MDKRHLEEILQNVAVGKTTPENAYEILKTLPYEDLGFVNIDQHRNIRTGYPEAIYCPGKTSKQIGEIFARLAESNDNIIGSRATLENYKEVLKYVPDATYFEEARMIVINRDKAVKTDKVIAIVTAGTADIPVAEEAAVTAEMLGNRVDKIYDVGVAGIHRLFGKLDRIRSANVIIVVAGMEGALASVVGGLVDKPVIAVPTSIGYGANLGGIAALLSMLNSCANGVGIVNIDNGFGAAYLASNINRL